MSQVMWRDDAVCLQIGTEAFFDDSPIVTAQAKAVCWTCPVRAECLEAALRVPFKKDYGVWGGLTRHERDGLRARRAA